MFCYRPFALFTCFIISANLVLGELLTTLPTDGYGVDKTLFLNMDIAPTKFDAKAKPSDIVNSCKAFILEFSDKASKFTKCSIQNARPLRFCEHCVQSYADAKFTYLAIMKGLVQDEAGTPCSNVILNSDKVEIIGQTARFIEKIWNDCSCESCFDVTLSTNSTSDTYSLSNDTIRFQKLVKTTWDCFSNYSSADIVPFPSNASISNKTVCHKCKAYYDQTNSFYIDLELKYTTNVCMDLVDSMNYTRMLWSKTFTCARPKEDIIGVMIISAIFCLLPIVFYVFAKCYGSRIEHKIISQKRLKQDDAPKKSSKNTVAGDKGETLSRTLSTTSF